MTRIEEITKHGEIRRTVYVDNQMVGYAIHSRDKHHWLSCNWEGAYIYTQPKSPRYKGQLEFIPTVTFFEAKQQILTNFRNKNEAFQAYIQEKSSKDNEIQYTGTLAMRMLTEGNDSFYPTPKTLAGKMCGKIRTDVKKLYNILEPSAGKGDLVDALKHYIDTKLNRRYDSETDSYEKIDVIEIDVNLQCLLKGRGFRVVGDDFLNYQTSKAYDLIFMNPDFSNGDAHLLKAIEIQEKFGGEIVCLLNAETIRNPYTNRRKLLKQKLINYNATIEFVEHAFMRAERKTDVEVAIIQLIIPKVHHHTLLDGYEKAKEKVVEEKEQLGIRKVGDFIYDMITDYQIEAEMSYKIISEVANALSVVNDKDDYKKLLSLHVCDRDMTGNPTEAYNLLLKKLRTRYWRRLFDKDEIRQKMTSAMSDEYSSKLSEMQDFEFNEFNIRNLIFELQSQLVDGIEDSLVTLFNKLSNEHSYYSECQNTIHYYNGWKTNKAHAVSFPKVIIPINGFSAHYNWEKSWSLDYRIKGIISDLERALGYLDKGETTFFISPKRIIDIANQSQNFKNMEFTYFYVTFYKKGTAHIKWKEEAKPLIERLNIFIGRKNSWLPPSYGKTRYDEMSDEEKKVIDSFQGKQEYEKVVDAPEKYILTSASFNAKLLTT